MGEKIQVEENSCLSSAESLIVFKEIETYIKKLENYKRKKDERKDVLLDEAYDGISKSENIKLYDCFINKLQTSIFSQMPGCQKEVISDGKQKFMDIAIEEQVDALISIITLLKSGRAGGIDLTAINGKSKSGAMYLGANLSSSPYDDIRIVDYSPAGLHRKESVNLKDFLK